MNQLRHFTTLAKRTLLIIAITITLPYCTSIPTPNIGSQTPSNSIEEQAQLANSQGQHLKAAALYEKLARDLGNDEHFLTAAAESYLSAGDIDNAERVISLLPNQLASSSVNIRLLRSKILLKQGKAEQSLFAIETIDESILNNQQRIELHTLRSSAFFQSGNIFESARERVELDHLITEPSDKLSNQNKLIETLLLLSNQALEIFKASPSDPVTSWVDLAITLKNKTPNIIDWQQRYPQHSANTNFVPNFLQTKQNNNKPAGKVGVFLPNGGPYAKSAQSIRQGIISAAYALDNNQADVTFYDTSVTPITTLYQQALSEGVKTIIGPLDKRNVADLQLLNNQTIPIIALNKFDGAAPNQTVSLSLAPEDDVIQVASLAWLKGHQRALILTPQTKFGQRIATHFADVWQQFGGTVNDVQTYPSKTSDYSASIKSVLNIEDSESRFKQLRNKLNLSMEFVERRRQDVDFIFLIASPRDGRLIKPQLRFFHAIKLPVFSISKIYDGTINPVANRDLDQVSFCDMPSLIEPTNYAELDTLSLTKQWGRLNSQSRRLFALGLDAYQSISHTERLKNSSFARFSGSTGVLSIKPNGKVSRQLTCATFKNGHIKSLGLAPQLEKTDYFNPLEKAPTPQTSHQTTPL
jgi:outer membrane PBP1 activator LpoA protein